MADPTSSLRTNRGGPSLFDQLSTAGQISQEDQYAANPENQFAKGLRTGAAGLTAGSFASEALRQEVAGDPAFADSRDRALQTVRDTQMYAPRISSLRDANSIGDAGDFVAGAVGQGAISMAPSLAAAVLTRGRSLGNKAAAFGGSMVPSYELERGEAALNQYQDPAQMAASAEERDLAATAKGGINAALESIVPAGLGSAFLRKPAGSFLGHVGRDFLTESATETAQQAVGFGAQKYIDPTKELDPWDLVDAAVAGGLTGGAMSAATRAPSHAVGAVLGGIPTPSMPEIKNPFQRGDAAADDGPVDLPPDTGGDGGAGPADTMLGKVAGLGQAVNDRFGDDIAAAGGKAKDMAGKAKGFVSDTLDRMTEAVNTAENPGDFLNKVFGGSIEDEAAADMTGAPNPALKGLTFEETEANIARDDAQRTARAARYADELLNDPATPDSVKQRVMDMQGDYANPDNQSFVTRTLVAQRGGEKVMKAAQDMVDLGKSAFAKGSEAASEGVKAAKKAAGDAATAAQERIVKKNLQSASPAEQAAFNKVVFDNLTEEAKASTFVRAQLSQVTNVLMAFAAKTGDITAKDLPVLTKLSNAMSMFKDPDALAAQLVEYGAIPRDADSFLGRVKSIKNARTDAKQPNSFLYMSLTPEAMGTLTGPMLQNLAQLVDEFSLQDAAGKGDAIIQGLSQAFGSPEGARAVLDYYAKQNKANLRFDPNETRDEHGDSPINEQDASALQPKYRAPNANRPFLRGRDDAALRAAAGDGLTGSLREHVAAKKGNAKLTAFDIRRDLQRRLDENVSRDTESVRGALAALDAHLSDAPQFGEWAGMEDARKLRDKLRSTKTEDRSAVVKALRDELAAQDKAMEQAKRAGKDPHEALLDLYDVALGQKDESKASDEQMTKFRELLDKGGKDPEKNKAIRKTAVTFPIDGKKVAVSLESMIYNSPEKGSIKERLLASLGLVAARADSMPDIKPDTIVKRNYYGKDQHLTWGALMGLNPKFTAKERKQNFRETAEDAARKAALDEVSASNLREYLKSLPQDVDALATSVKILGNVEKAQKELSVQMDLQPTKALGQQARQLASKARVLKAFINETLDADYPIDRETILERLNAEQEETFDQDSDTAYKDILVAEAQMEALRDRADAVKGTKLADQYEGRAEEIASELDRGLSRLQPWQRMNEEDRPSGRKTPVDAAREAEYARRAKEDKALAEEDAQRPKAEPGRARQGAGIETDSSGFNDDFDAEGFKSTVRKIVDKTIGDLVKVVTSDANGVQGAAYSITDDGAYITLFLETLEYSDLRPEEVGHHESAHAVVQIIQQKYGRDTAKAVVSLADKPYIREQIEELTGFSAPYFQTSPEELFAQAYALWAMGELKLKAEPRLTRVFKYIKELLVGVKSDQALADVFNSMLEGDFANRIEKLEQSAFVERMDDSGDFFVYNNEFQPTEALVDKFMRQNELSDTDIDRKALMDKAVFVIAMYMMNSSDSKQAKLDAFEEFMSAHEQSEHKQSAMDPLRGKATSVLTKDEQQKIIDEIARIRGKDVKVAFAKFADIGASGEFSMNKDKTKRLIKIAINSLNPMSVAWHESLHDFMAMLGGSQAERKLKADLLAAAEAPQVVTKLRELLKGHPKALEQIENDREERLAYMYQFWAEGALPLGQTGTNIFSRAVTFFREMLGVLSQDQKIDKLFTALHTGKFSEPSLVAAVLEDMKAQTLGDKARAVAGPIGDAAEAMFTGATDRLRDTNIDALTELADMFHREPGRENSGELPFLQRRAQQVGKRLNKLQDILKDTTSEERRRALENMQAMKPASSPLEKELAAYLKEMHDYMVDRGVKRFDTKAKKWVALGNVKDYFPRVWDKNTIRNNEAEFIALLEQYVGKAQARESFNALVNGDGSLELAENEHHLGFTPWNPAVLDRRFTFIDPSNASDFAKYQSKDMADIMTSYTQRAVHRAEYASSFGNNGEVITEKFIEAQKQGATPEEIDMARKATMAMEGTLGYEFNPRLKEVMSGIVTYQNIVLLPLSLFSNLIDPLGVAMRSNDMKEAWKAFTYGIKGIADQIRGAGDDAQTEMARTLGLIDEQNMLEAMGHVYNSMHMSRFLKNINSKFFRYNGMEMWNQRMRVAAMMAAQRFIISHAGGGALKISHSGIKNDSSSYKNHSKRYLEELGITESDVFQLKDGTIALTKDQLLQAGAKKADVLDIEKRIQAAVFKWVDGAVLRPNAAHRPVWGSDPRYQLIFHLKQFTFSFQNTILRRVGEELKHGNVAPGWILMSYVPFMFLSDVMKGSLTGTLNTSADLYDVASQSIARSGIMGTGVFGADAMGDLERGKLPGTSFLGPAFGHLTTLLSGITGHAGVEQVMDRSVPFAKYV